MKPCIDINEFTYMHIKEKLLDLSAKVALSFHS